MKTSNRLEYAITKLYNAFHNNESNPECCKQCAVGNILDKTDSWKHLSDYHGSVELNYIGEVHQSFGRSFNGYSSLELLKIEATFLDACGYKLPLYHKNNKPENPTDKSVLFDGLSAVIKLLCMLDGVSNVMDYTKLFEFKNETPKHELV
jgi:hypothetical protein